MLEFFANLAPSLVGLEACAGAHQWARALKNYGHEVKLVAPYRKSGKAVGRPAMRFVPVKDVAQQAVLMVHRARELLVSERTALVNQMRGLLGEYGLVLAQSVAQMRRALPCILEDAENRLPVLAREICAELGERLRECDRRIAEYDRRLRGLAKEMAAAQRLMPLEGVGPITATAVVASVGDGRVFESGRPFAAWLGLTIALAAKHARILWAMLARGTDYRVAM